VQNSYSLSEPLTGWIARSVNTPNLIRQRTLQRHFGIIALQTSNVELRFKFLPLADYTRHCRLLWAAILYHKHEEIVSGFSRALDVPESSR
jgi:hypothetical protein